MKSYRQFIAEESSKIKIGNAVPVGSFVELNKLAIEASKRAAADLLPYWDKKVHSIGIDIEPTEDGKQDRGYINLDTLKDAERWSRR